MLLQSCVASSVHFALINPKHLHSCHYSEGTTIIPTNPHRRCCGEENTFLWLQGMPQIIDTPSQPPQATNLHPPLNFSEWKSSERIYPLAAGLDSNFRQDVRVRHFHGYGIRALCPPVSVKLENVCWIFHSGLCGWKSGGWGSGWWDSHEDVRVGVDLRWGGTEINRVLMVMMMMEDTSWSQLMVVLVNPETR